MLNTLRHYWDRWFAEPLRKVEADALAYRLDPNRGPDWKTPIVLLVAAVSLLVQNYTTATYQVITELTWLARVLAGPETAADVYDTLRRWGNDPLGSRVWWALVSTVTYVALPIVALKLVFRQRLSDHGLKLRGLLRAWPLYVLFVMVMVPLVIMCSAEDRFQATYPFVPFRTREDVHANLWKWDLAYAAQFVGLEFFFRGFMVHGLKHRFGAYAVFVSMVPYVQIHFGKPMPEATASIVAGVVLGYMSLVTRSVWLGAALHIGVAWGMDCACLYRRGLL
jgi:membrane protease YdiL (CAAX protease family)